MEIKVNNDLFEVLENGAVVYTALSEGEAQGFIDWRNRPAEDAGNPQDCVNC